MEGTSVKERLQSTYWGALQKNWMVWPLVQSVNFKFVPLEGRVLVVNLVSLGECFCFSFLFRFGEFGARSDGELM